MFRKVSATAEKRVVQNFSLLSKYNIDNNLLYIFEFLESFRTGITAAWSSLQASEFIGKLLKKTEKLIYYSLFICTMLMQNILTHLSEGKGKGISLLR